MVSSRPLVGVLALQGDTDLHLRALRGAGAGAEPVAVAAGIDRVDALVLPGGESTTMAKLADRYGIAEPLRKRIRAGMPVFGTCAGMVLLADRSTDGAAGRSTLGGIDMTVRRNAFGGQVDSFEDEVELAGVGGGPVEAVFIRAPWVEDAGPGVTVLGTLGAGEAAGRIVAVRQGSLLATSFHPELTGDARIHRLFVDIVKGTA